MNILGSWDKRRDHSGWHYGNEIRLIPSTSLRNLLFWRTCVRNEILEMGMDADIYGERHKMWTLSQFLGIQKFQIAILDIYS